MISAPKNVIIVDNNEERYKRLIVIVRKFGYNVFVATSSTEFMKLAGGITPHAVVLNYNMPRFAADVPNLKKIRSIPACASSNIIMMSGEEDHDKIEAAINEGANACIVWPNTANALFLVFEHLLGSGKRKSPRIRVIYKSLMLVNGEKKSFVVTSLSVAGVFMRSVTPLPLGTKVRMLLDLPTTRPLEADGEVVDVAAYDPVHHTEPGMGIRFMNLDSSFEQAIGAFVESLLTVEISDNTVI